MKNIPGSDLVVSELCLGTMTFGEQLRKDQGFDQLDKATKVKSLREKGVHDSSTTSIPCP